jgi:uncharacterized metal-binding protein YceD (DUF177 family)
MSNFTVKLGTITSNKKSFSFEVRDSFFEAFSFSELVHANISAIATLDKDGENISLNLKIKGQINQLDCDICAHKLSVHVFGEANLIIKKTNEDLLSTDEILYVKKHENQLNLKHLIFELIVLSTPKKRQHALDKQGKRTCNKEMLNLLNKYTQTHEKTSDPRWDALKNLN